MPQKNYDFLLSSCLCSLCLVFLTGLPWRVIWGGGGYMHGIWVWGWGYMPVLLMHGALDLYATRMPCMYPPPHTHIYGYMPVFLTPGVFDLSAPSTFSSFSIFSSFSSLPSSSSSFSRATSAFCSTSPSFPSFLLSFSSFLLSFAPSFLGMHYIVNKYWKYVN